MFVFGKFMLTNSSKLMYLQKQEYEIKLEIWKKEKVKKGIQK